MTAWQLFSVDTACKRRSLAVTLISEANILSLLCQIYARQLNLELLTSSVL